MKFTPRLAQEKMIQFALENPKCALLASMGIGKSSAIATVVDLEITFGDVKRVLILAPLRVATSVWPQELRLWDHLQHLEYSVITGTEAQRLKAFAADVPIHIINYDNIPWLLNVCKGQWPYDRVISDEASKLKGYKSVSFAGTPERKTILENDQDLVAAAAKATKRGRSHRATHARDGRPLFIEHARPGLMHIIGRTKRWTNMTGTCAPNSVEDLWSQTYLLDGGTRLGKNITAFRREFMVPHPYVKNKWIPRPGSMEQVTDRIKDICLTLEAKDYYDLPPLNELVIPVPLPEDSRAQYRELQRDFMLRLERGEITAQNAAVLSGKLLQFTAGFLFHEDKSWERIHDAKLDTLEDIIDDMNGEPILVIYHFKPDQERILARFPGAVVFASGDIEARWNLGEIPVMLVNAASAGHGLSLQKPCNQAVFYSMDWNLENHQQVIERIGPTRQFQSGLDRPVFVHYLISPGTVDEAVLLRLQSKAEVQDAIKSAMKRFD